MPMIFGGGGGDTQFTYKMLVYAMAVMFLLSTSLAVFASYNESTDETTSELLDGYYEFTGNKATSEAVWVLTGIYTPYYTGAYGYTEDGWLYGSIVGAAYNSTSGTGGYTPSQYKGDLREYQVAKGSDGVYRYVSETEYGNHSSGDLYTDVTMDAQQKSNTFFTSSGKNIVADEDTEFFYYEYTGYRYSFQPRANYTTYDSDGNTLDVTATTTSLSLIWYEYAAGSGISGQLIISGSDSGVAYLTKQQIVTAFDTITSAAKFSMVFNGVPMNIYIKMDPSMIAAGISIEECYERGYWSVMVSSQSTDVDAYSGTDYSFNIYSIFQTMIDLFTFDMAKYGFTGIIATLASIVFVMPLYSALISIGMNNYPVLILAGILAAIQTIASLWPF